MRAGVSFCSLLLLFLVPACTPVVKNPTPLHDLTVQETQAYVEPEYRIQVGDQLDIKFFYNSELNEQVIVRPDGCISLQLIQDVKAAGLTPVELRDLLTERYANELRKPSVTVIVRAFGGRAVFVDGEVNRPSMINVIRPITVMQSISQAGGVKEGALTTEVIVIRSGSDRKAMVIPVDISKVIDGTDLGQDIVLRPFDIVYVPKSPIANVNMWVDQYLRKNIPVYFGLSYELAP